MIIVITGPTCMGKSETALEVAKAFNAVIINGDAFQCYKEMNIGVAKPPKEYFDIVPHKLFSFVDVNHDYSIAEYQKNLRNKIDELETQLKQIDKNAKSVILEYYNGDDTLIYSKEFKYRFVYDLLDKTYDIVHIRSSNKCIKYFFIDSCSCTGTFNGRLPVSSFLKRKRSSLDSVQSISKCNLMFFPNFKLSFVCLLSDVSVSICCQRSKFNYCLLLTVNLLAGR